MSPNGSPQLTPVNLVRLDGSPTLTGLYIVDLLPVHDDLNPSERLVSSGRQSIPLTGYQELELGDVLGTASSPFLRVPLEALTLHDVPADVSALAESPTTPASQTALPHSTTPDPPDEPPPNSYTDSITANANYFFASGTPFPPTFVGYISRWTRLVGTPLPSTLFPQHLPPTRTSSRRLNWTTVNVLYVRSKSRYLQGLRRFNRAPTD